MRAGGSRRNVERRTDLFVRPPRRNEPHDLELAARQPGNTLRDRPRRRASAELAHLLTRRIELTLGAEMREDLMCPFELAHCAVAIARLREHARELTPQPRRMRHVW